MKVLEQLEGLVSSKIDAVSAFLTIVKLETRLAKLSILPLLLSVGFLTMLIFTIWLSAMAWLFYGVLQFYHNVAIAMGAVLGLNVMGVAVLSCYLVFHLKQMRFEKTRHYLEKGLVYEPTKTTAARHRSKRKSVIKQTN